MKIGRFVQNPFNEHLVLTHKPNKEIKKKKPSYIYFFGIKIEPESF